MTYWKASLSRPDDAWRVLETQHWSGVYEERELPLIYLCVHAHVQNVKERPEVDFGYHSSGRVHLVLWARVPHRELTMHARLVAQKDLGIHLSLITNSAHTTMPTFSHGFWDLSTGPHARMTNISLNHLPCYECCFEAFGSCIFLAVSATAQHGDPCPAKIGREVPTCFAWWSSSRQKARKIMAEFPLNLQSQLQPPWFIPMTFI